MKRLSVALFVFALSATGACFAGTAPISGQPGGEQIVYLETDSGTKIKVHVPKEEMEKVKKVKKGEKVQLMICMGGGC